LPENSSPSKPTVPASSAVCSVSDSFGVTLANSLQQRRTDLAATEIHHQQRHGDRRLDDQQDQHRPRRARD
jgi:hypothetical protein